MNRTASHTDYKFAAILLAVALLFAQWTGWQHRISHARLQAHGQAANLISLDASVDDDSSGAGHSCIAFDAVAIGDCVHLVPFVAPRPARVHLLALWVAVISRDAPFFSHFSSRAPPSMFAS